METKGLVLPVPPAGCCAWSCPFLSLGRQYQESASGKGLERILSGFGEVRDTKVQPKRGGWGGPAQAKRGGPSVSYTAPVPTPTTPPSGPTSLSTSTTLSGAGKNGTRYIVVLGKRLKKNGKPELCLSERLAFAIDHFKSTYQPGHFLVMSGSMVEKRANMTEAECMKRIAVEAGVDPSLILLEEVSWNTFSNAFCTKKLLHQLITNRDRVTEVVVVTSDFHGSRVQRVFEAVFEDCRHSFIALSFANAPATLTEAQVAREARAETQMLAKFDADLQRHLAMTW